MKKLEVACFSPEDAKIAIEMGADRIEFCLDYSCGGITPNLDEFILLRSQFPEATIHVMIRPREGDFVYSSYKLELMKIQMSEFEIAGADGFVFGVLNDDHTINESDCRFLIDSLKSQKNLVFHRAFDLVPNPEESLQILINLGFSGVLTSGGQKSAFDGANNLKNWSKKFQPQLQFIAGGGIRANNIETILETGTEWIHTAAWDSSNQCLHKESLQSIVNVLKA